MCRVQFRQSTYDTTLNVRQSSVFNPTKQHTPPLLLFLLLPNSSFFFPTSSSNRHHRKSSAFLHLSSLWTAILRSVRAPRPHTFQHRKPCVALLGFFPLHSPEIRICFRDPLCMLQELHRQGSLAATSRYHPYDMTTASCIDPP